MARHAFGDLAAAGRRGPLHYFAERAAEQAWSRRRTDGLPAACSEFDLKFGELAFETGLHGTPAYFAAWKRFHQVLEQRVRKSIGEPCARAARVVAPRRLDRRLGSGRPAARRTKSTRAGPDDDPDEPPPAKGRLLTRRGTQSHPRAHRKGWLL